MDSYSIVGGVTEGGFVTFPSGHCMTEKKRGQKIEEVGRCSRMVDESSRFSGAFGIVNSSRKILIQDLFLIFAISCPESQKFCAVSLVGGSNLFASFTRTKGFRGKMNRPLSLFTHRGSSDQMAG